MATIVVIDDDAPIRRAIGVSLRQEGHDVLEFEDAAPALDGADFKGVDLVITDLMMPLLGEQFILILRESGILAPVIVISAHLSEAREHYLATLGVHRFLEKPFSLSRLTAAVKDLVEDDARKN